MNPIAANATVKFVGLVDKLMDELAAKDRREHEARLQELQMIDNSSLRDTYVQQLLLDRLLAPIEAAQHAIQNTAKHAQYLAEVIPIYHQDHGLTKEQSVELSQQLRVLAIKLTCVESLHELKLIYAVITLFVEQVSQFGHPDRKYRIDRSMRKNMLDPVNTCIATKQNFYLRLGLMDSSTVTGTADAESTTALP